VILRDPAEAFAATYAEARAKFADAAKARGYRLAAHGHPDVRGAEGETLAMDVATTGGDDAAGLLVITSATHGVEGFCGSGCQVGLLGDDSFAAAVAATGAAVAMVHAVNPYGFSHLRRTNEGNVDLNRNFRSFAAPPAPNASYAEVHPFVVPATWPPAPDNEAWIGAYLRERGPAAFQQAVTGGQCEFPDGLFYGGTAPAWSNTTLRSVLREHGRRRRRVALIDVHTGLGPCGHGEKIYVGEGDAASVARTRATFGADVTSYFDGSSTSAALTGVIDQAVRDACPSARFTGIGLEYGTVDLMTTLQALRADQWLANHGGAQAAQRGAIKRAMRDAFYVDRPDWKAMVWGQARVAALQALRGLAA
jgi:hypothetical protein